MRKRPLLVLNTHSTASGDSISDISVDSNHSAYSNSVDELDFLMKYTAAAGSTTLPPHPPVKRRKKTAPPLALSTQSHRRTVTSDTESKCW
jgi:hypothetical protein